MSYENPSLIARLTRSPLSLAFSLIGVAVLLSMTLAVATETRQGVVLRLGQPVRIINRYHPKEEMGLSGAGLVARVPFLEQIVWIDKRIKDIEMSRQPVLSTDQLRLNVDAFARYRITDPLRMIRTARTESRVADALRPLLGSSLRNELGKRQSVALLSPERGQVMDNIKRSLNVVARQYGAEIVDVRIKRADLPEGTPLDSAYERMRNAREQEALTIQAQGAQQAQIIRAEADAKAAEVYAASFGKDPDFYDFYRAMQSYRHTFGTDGTTPEGSTTVVLSPTNDYLREFRGGGR